VLQIEATDLNLPTDHPMHLGFDATRLLPRADVVLVLDAPVPWIPRVVSPQDGAKLIHLAPDPLQSRYPYREYEADLLITGTSAAGLPMLADALRETGAAAKVEAAAGKSPDCATRCSRRAPRCWTARAASSR